MNEKVLKIAGIVLSGVGMAATLAGNLVSDARLKLDIAKEVTEQITKQTK